MLLKRKNAGKEEGGRKGRKKAKERRGMKL